MSPVKYLAIPERYAARLGGLRWSEGFDAVEYPTGETFAFGREIAIFLNGFARGGRIPEFAHVLHLLHLFGQGTLSTDHPAIPLLERFVASGRPLRNAGALASELCAELESRPGLPAFEDVELQLTRGPVALFTHQDIEPSVVTELDADVEAMWRLPPTCSPPPREPLIEFEAFERRFLKALDKLSGEELTHWLKHGTGRSTDGEELARQVDALTPRTVGAAFEVLRERPRLAGAFAIVERLSAALRLPPRASNREKQPIGGYTDIATRGPLERLLPTQFALDRDELMRRFASRELLYYHREEPQEPDGKELVVLLDQGIRTWGAVRLTLTAACVALAKAADKRGQRFLLATTGRCQPIEPLRISTDALAAMVEASDFSEGPGPALEQLMGELDPTPRDLVILSHPRSLADPAFARSGSVVSAGTRVFALGVDETGCAVFCERRAGGILERSRFRVEPPTPASTEPRKSRREAAAGDWSGDVEAIGFPFRVRPPSLAPGPFRAAFDEESHRLFVGGEMGIVWALALDGSMPELMPRSTHMGQLLGPLASLIGVAGGVVTVSKHPSRDTSAVSHYDWATRRVRVLELEAGPPAQLEWMYDPRTHLLIARAGERLHCLRLAGGDTFDYPSNESVSHEESAAIRWALDQAVAPPDMLVLHDRDTLPGRGPWVRLRTDAGTLLLHGIEPPWRPFRPLLDGLPLMARRRVLHAQYRGKTLALISVSAGGRVAEGTTGPEIHLFHGPDGRLLPDRPWSTRKIPGFALSADGERIAICVGREGVQIHDTAEAGRPISATRGGFGRTPSIHLGEDWLAIRSDSHGHLFEWGKGRLHHRHARLIGNSLIQELIRGRKHATSAPTAGKVGSDAWFDPVRFPAFAETASLIALIDVFGQVAVFNRHQELLGMFYAPDHRYASWLPDGSRFGTTELGGPRTPESAVRIARRLNGGPTHSARSQT